MQKLLMTFFLPWRGLFSRFMNSQVQCLVRWTCFAASVWHSRHALVTSGPVAKGPSNCLNLLWSAVDLRTFCRSAGEAAGAAVGGCAAATGASAAPARAA